MPTGPLARLVGLAEVDLAGLLTGLAVRGLTVGCAESLTGGLLAAVLTEVPGASAVVRGGLVVYATDLKHSLAGVDADLLADRGPVDPDVAWALADGARRACGAAVGLGLTGVAGPDPQDGVPVGTWYVAMTGPMRRLSTHTPADPASTDRGPAGAAQATAAPADAAPAIAAPAGEASGGSAGEPPVDVRSGLRFAAVRAGVRLLLQLADPDSAADPDSGRS